MDSENERSECSTQNLQRSCTPRTVTCQTKCRDHSGSKWEPNTSCTAILSKVENCLRNSPICGSPGPEWAPAKKQTFGGTLRRDVGSASSNLTHALDQTPSVVRGCPDASRKHESCRFRGNRFAGGGLSTARWTKLVSGVTGRKPANRKNARTAIHRQNGLFGKKSDTVNRLTISFWNEAVKFIHKPGIFLNIS